MSVTSEESVAPRPGPTATLASPRRWRSRARIDGADRALLAAVVVVIVPIVVAVIRGIRRGWQPLGDNSYFLVRSRDVLTHNNPLLGTWTSASQATDTNFNNPGPLLFDLWAIPSKLFGATGLAVGVVIVNCLAVIGIAVMVRRRSGPTVAVAAVALTGVLCWSMGSEMLYDPWQPHSLLLTFLFLLTCVWSSAAGDRMALPWVLGLGSVVIQTHLSYAVLIVALVGWAVVALAASEFSEHRGNVDGRPAQRRRLLVLGGVCMLVVGVCWAQPLYENFTSSGDGNLVRLAKNASATGDRIGVRTGVRVVADTVAVPPFWLRPSFQDDLAPRPGSLSLGSDSVSPSFGAAVALLLGLEVVLAGGAFVFLRRRSDATTAAGLATGAVALAAGVITAVKLPGGAFGLAAHKFRWLWPLSSFITLVVIAALLRLVVDGRQRTDRSARTPPASWALTGIAVVVALATLPMLRTDAGAASAYESDATVATMRTRMGVLAGKGPILIDLAGNRFGEPYSGAAMGELQSRGIPFVMHDEVLVRQFGEGRRQHGPARALTFRQGDLASDRIPGSDRVVYVAGLDPKQQRERRRLRRQVLDLIGRGLSVDRPTAVGVGVDPSALPAGGDRRGAVALLDDGTLDRLMTASALRVGPSAERAIRRLLDLDLRWTDQTVGLYLTSTPQRVAP